MRRGEKVIILIIVLVVAAAMGKNIWVQHSTHEVDQGIPYYSTATPELSRTAMDIYRENGCKKCHSLWTVKNMQETVPAPILDGIGSLRTEEWLYSYLSTESPQEILPTRLLPEWKMPSYAKLSEQDRKALASYLASLKVKDWYLEDTRKAEYQKLTGKPYKHE